LRDQLIEKSNQSVSMIGRSRFKTPGVWSLRFIPVVYISPAVEAQLKRSLPAGNGSGDLKTKVAVSQRRVIAMVYDLKNGGYVMELLHSLPHQPSLVSSRDIRRFLERIHEDIQTRGGVIHLPERGARDDINYAYQQLEVVAKRMGLNTVQDMPPNFPLKREPYLRVSQATQGTQAEQGELGQITSETHRKRPKQFARPIYRDNDESLPCAVSDSLVPEKFSPRAPPQHLGRPIKKTGQIK